MADPRLDAIARTVNELLLDKGIRHGIGLERLKNRIVRELVGFLNDDVFPDVIARLSSRLDRIASRGSDSGVWSTARYEGLRDAIRDSIDEGSAAVRAMYLEELTGVAKMEAAWAANGIGEQVAKFGLDVTKPSVPLLRAIVSTEPFEGAVAKDWFEKFSADTQRGVIHAIDVGLAQGETVDQMVTRIRGTRAAGYADGVFQTSRNQAEMIVRTGVAHVTSRAREQTYSENSDIVDGVEIVATLDHRVCERCAGLDGKVFKPGEGPRPPFHPLCRCSHVPALKSWKDLGINLREAPDGTRASMNGEVPDSMTFPEWLKTQSREVQNDVLGVRKAAKWRSGELSIDQFTNDRGRILTLEELAKL